MMSDKDIEEYNKISWQLKWNKKFEYPKSQREIIKGRRHYSVSDQKLPSVTTILSKTQPKEKRDSLAQWRERVGNAEATRIMDQAAARGTAMHTLLEHYLLGEKHADLTDIGQQATMMAEKVIDEGIKGHLDEVWGSEVTVWYPDLFAGATDVVGVYDGKESIVDFKQTNKPKKREWIDDYFLQLAAYAMAHNFTYQTEIIQGVVLMCSKDGYFQKFEVSEEEFKQYKHRWLARVSQYYDSLE
jgi:genome maintenance exonuclease 1|tara:strand:- start:3076 stop:3804 length:729 start_codon:yes stop_codon:yes gene_type:complete